MATTEPVAMADPFQLCGTTIEGKYRVASVVGDGGFGVVYRGVHKGFGELIAIKCLKIAHELDVPRREALLEQLRDEGRLLHRLSKVTSGIVQALDVGAVSAPSGAWVPYLVLEWLEGETLAEHLSARNARGDAPYALVDAVRLLEPAARALAVAHQQKIAHRDVKPPNLFVTEVGGARTLKVLDFGIAKVITESTANLEVTKQAPSAFTPRYGAPEQFNKQRGASGPWTDVFALALILVEVATGKKALDGDDPTQLYIASADPSQRPTVRARGGVAPDAVERVLEKALAIDPRARYGDAGEFWDALTDAAGLPRAPRASTPSLSPSVDDTVGSAGGAATTDPGKRAPSTPRVTVPTQLGATLPAESLGDAVRLPVVVDNLSRISSNKVAIVGAPAAARSAADDRDPMAETPIHARLPPAPVSRRAELTLLPKPAPKPARSGVVPLVVFVVAAGAVVAYFFVRGPDDPSTPRGHGVSATVHPTARPSARSPRSAAKTSATAPLAAPSGAASAAVLESATPALPSAPPEDMVAIPHGKYALGEGAESREVTLTHPVFLDKFEVTTRAYLDCVAARKCGPADRVSVALDSLPIDAVPPASAAPAGSASAAPSASAPPVDPQARADEFIATWSRRCNAPRKALDHPINCVDFRGADAFCKWKGKRLPSEAEWEAAARGHEARPFAWGDSPPECGRACYDKNGECFNRSNGIVATCAGGLFPADRTPEGVYDMGGDVAEWVADGFAAAPARGLDPVGEGSAALRVVRGGSFLDPPELLRASHRVGVAPGTAHVSIGFRCAMDGASAADAGP